MCRACLLCFLLCSVQSRKLCNIRSLAHYVPTFCYRLSTWSRESYHYQSALTVCKWKTPDDKKCSDWQSGPLLAIFLKSIYFNYVLLFGCRCFRSPSYWGVTDPQISLTMPVMCMMKETAYNFHRKIIRPADGWLFEFWLSWGRLLLWCHGYGEGRPRKSTAMKTSARNVTRRARTFAAAARRH